MYTKSEYKKGKLNARNLCIHGNVFVLEMQNDLNLNINFTVFLPHPLP